MADLSALNSSCGYKNKVQITSSGTWTVPEGVNQIEIWATGGGGAGGFAEGNTAPCAGGGAGGTGIAKAVNVSDGDSLNIIIGAGSNGSATGGNTIVQLGNIAIAVGEGGWKGGNNLTNFFGTGGLGASVSSNGYAGGAGGRGSPSGDTAIAFSGDSPRIPFSSTGPAPSKFIAGITSFSASVGGTSNSTRASGGGGGSSIYGRGGNGGGTERNAEDAPASSYGAGGGGARGGAYLNGGAGANGIVEIWY